jgi:hypothetical protein
MLRHSIRFLLLSLALAAATSAHAQGMIDLGASFGAAVASEAIAINDRGDVVGTVNLPAPGGGIVPHAVLWREGEAIDLNRDVQRLYCGRDRTACADTGSNGVAINASGEVVIQTGNANGLRVVVWRDGIAQDIGSLSPGTPADFTSLQSGWSFERQPINGRGDVIVSSGVADGTGVHAALWSNQQLVDIGTPVEGWSTQGLMINDAGQAVITAGPPLFYGSQVYFWDRGSLTNLGLVLESGGFGLGGAGPTAINRAGQVVGSLGGGRSFFWDPVEGMKTLEGVAQNCGSGWGGSDSCFGFSSANDVNDSGLAVGESTTPSSALRAVAWAGSTPTDLGSLHGDSGQSSAARVNSRGTVLGTSWSGDYSGVTRTFVWHRGQMPACLATRGCNDVGALKRGGFTLGMAINSCDQVVGISDNGNTIHAFLWSPQNSDGSGCGQDGNGQ